MEYNNNPMKDSGDYIEPKEYFTLLETCQNDLEKMFVMILWKTGRRVSEIVGNKRCDGLKPKDIDYTNEKIHFWILKKKILVKEPKDADADLLAELKAYVERNKIGDNERIIPRTRRWGNLILRRLSEKSDVKTFSGRKLHNHAFRHSWNVMASRAGTHPEDIVLQKDIMSHSNINITMSYLKFAQGRQKELVDKMSENLKKEKKFSRDMV